MIKVITILALVMAVSLANEQSTNNDKKQKRGLLDLGYGYDSAAYAQPSIYTSGLHTSAIITKHVPLPIIQKVAVPVDRPLPYAVPIVKEVIKHVPVPYPQSVVVEKYTSYNAPW
ncbi:uncharacterized protein LOC106640473 [Copidosoma floridanum]|uniref:uncharacterized protein LOC106640473 n=1 Tax=Copidosoma floridanum TaxID=29053 RepID=UPI0006C98D98|nr:uncharacterized protein LOC106640473 [Copidosoma floridanum]